MRGISRAVLLNKLNISLDVEEYTVKITHADLAEAMASRNRNTVSEDAIRDILNGDAWDLFETHIDKYDAQYAYENSINDKNMQTIKNLGSTEESIFDDNDDVYYAILRAAEDATTDATIARFEDAVELALSDSLPKWATIKDIGFGDRESTFTVNTQSFIDGVDYIRNNYDTVDEDTLGEMLKSIIETNSSGVYARYYDWYDDDVFNQFLSDALSEIE